MEDLGYKQRHPVGFVRRHPIGFKSQESVDVVLLTSTGWILRVNNQRGLVWAANPNPSSTTGNDVHTRELGVTANRVIVTRTSAGGGHNIFAFDLATGELTTSKRIIWPHLEGGDHNDDVVVTLVTANNLGEVFVLVSFRVLTHTFSWTSIVKLDDDLEILDQIILWDDPESSSTTIYVHRGDHGGAWNERQPRLWTTSAGNVVGRLGWGLNRFAGFDRELTPTSHDLPLPSAPPGPWTGISQKWGGMLVNSDGSPLCFWYDLTFNELLGFIRDEIRANSGRDVSATGFLRCSPIASVRPNANIAGASFETFSGVNYGRVFEANLFSLTPLVREATWPNVVAGWDFSATETSMQGVLTDNRGRQVFIGTNGYTSDEDLFVSFRRSGWTSSSDDLGMHRLGGDYGSVVYDARLVAVPGQGWMNT